MAMTQEEKIEIADMVRSRDRFGPVSEEELAALPGKETELWIRTKNGKTVHVFEERPENLPEQAALLLNFHGGGFLVTFVDDITQINLPEIGPELENHHLFPDRTNVEFAQIVCKDTIRMRVWERGSGITQACGTGACATAVAAFINELTGRKSDIIMDGGTVTIEWDEASGHILMTGPATKVFDGEFEEIEG